MLDNTNDSAEVRRLLAMNEANHASPSNFDQLANLINVPLFPRWLIYAVLLLVLVSGTGLTVWRAQTADREMRIGLLSQAAALARTINPDLVKSLSFTAADQTSTAFLEIRRQMTTYGEALGLKNIFSQAIQQGRIVSGPDNRDEKSPQAALPGTIYQGPSLASKEAFNRAEACTEGPYTDARGTFVSAFAPVKDPRTGRLLMMLGLDQDARDWNAALWRNRIVSLTFVVALAALLLVGDRLLQWRIRRKVNHHRGLRHAEVCLTVAVGLLCTWGATLAVGEHELRARQELFLQAADGQTALVRQREAHIRDSLLPKLARFIGDNTQLTRTELHSYVRSASELAGVQTVEWIPCVPTADKNRFEAETFRNGFTNLVIFGKYYQGEILPAPGSAVYFPVVYAGPQTGNENDLSYTMGAEPLRQAALEETRRTGLAAATDPIKTGPVTATLNNLLVYQPIFPPA